MSTKNKGSVLLIATFIILLSSILIIGFLEVSATDMEILRNLKNDCMATYIADAGLEAAICDLLNSGEGIISRTEFPDTADDNTYYTTVQTDKIGSTYIIESTGEVGSFNRVVEGRIKVLGNKVNQLYWKEK